MSGDGDDPDAVDHHVYHSLLVVALPREDDVVPLAVVDVVQRELLGLGHVAERYVDLLVIKAGQLFDLAAYDLLTGKKKELI